MTVLPPRPPPDITLAVQPPGVPWPTTSWPLADEHDPALTDATRARLDELLDIALPPDGDEPVGELGQTLAVVVVKDGRLIAERYGPTAAADERLISWSMAKSITHALVGILVGEGRLDIAAPAPVPEWRSASDDRSTITVDQLLRMVPGTLFVEDYVDDDTSHCLDMLFGDGQDDMGAYTAALPSIAPPDTVFNYSSGTTMVVCRILAAIVGSGDAFEQWMRTVLLDPLGIDGELTFDRAGTWVGSSFFHTTAREYAKFGLLYARDGVWDGTRILPEGWVDHGRTPRAIDDTDGSVYGAHWWIRPEAREVFYAAGYETQRVIIDPVADSVVVRLGKTPVEVADNVDRWLDRIGAVLRQG